MNLLLTGCFRYSEDEFSQLRLLGYDVHFMQHEAEELPLCASEIDAIVCNSIFLHHDIGDFSRLKFIQLTSAGLDRVPLDEITKRGILIRNARGVYSIPMAEWAVFRILEHYKQGWFFRQKQNCCCWEKHRELRELAGTKVAVIGAGNVGQEVAKRFQALGTLTTGFDIHTNPTVGFDSMEYIAALKERVPEFDIIVITAPLLPETRGLFSRELMQVLKHDASVVNISRGGLVDQAALIEVFSARKDLFAALDVFEDEPLPNTSPLWGMDNIAVSPHNSFVSDVNNSRMFNLMKTNLAEFIHSLT